MADINGYVPAPTADITASFVPYSSCMFVLDHALQARATTQYIDYEFNSMVKFGDVYLGASTDGIYELDGDTDDGDAIGAYFEPVVTDFGINNPKKVRFIFLGYEAEGDLIVTLGDNRSQKSFTVDSVVTGQQWRRITGSRSIRGRYLTFQVSNVDGCDFGIDSIDVALVVMPRSFKI